MEIIPLEVQDTVCKKIIDFLVSLPEDQCHLLLDGDLSDSEKLENEELNKIVADSRLSDGQAFFALP